MSVAAVSISRTRGSVLLSPGGAGGRFDRDRSGGGHKDVMRFEPPPRCGPRRLRVPGYDAGRARSLLHPRLGRGAETDMPSFVPVDSGGTRCIRERWLRWHWPSGAPPEIDAPSPLGVIHREHRRKDKTKLLGLVSTATPERRIFASILSLLPCRLKFTPSVTNYVISRCDRLESPWNECRSMDQT